MRVMKLMWRVTYLCGVRVIWDGIRWEDRQNNGKTDEEMIQTRQDR